MLGFSSIVILDTLLSLHALTIFDFNEYYHSICISKSVKGAATPGSLGLIAISVTQIVNLLFGKQCEPDLRGTR